MRTIIRFIAVLIPLMVPFLFSCGGGSSSASGGGMIADYTVANQATLRSIPVEYINMARTTLHVVYQHTSHGTHVSYGIYGLPNFKTGDAALFGVTQNAAVPDANRLDFNDFDGNSGQYIDALSAGDLSQSDNLGLTPPAFVQNTREYLDNAANADINVVMWSWCSISGHDIHEYLTGMQTLINEYGPGGSQIGVTRSTPVTFIFMTGHAETGNNIGDGQPYNQAQLIIDYCAAHGYYCLDYYSIDTHDMNGNYYSDTGDNGDSVTFGGNFLQLWESTHDEGTDWYANRVVPGGATEYGNHNDQHITANRKAFAFWWILARIAGWNG